MRQRNTQILEILNRRDNNHYRLSDLYQSGNPYSSIFSNYSDWLRNLEQCAGSSGHPPTSLCFANTNALNTVLTYEVRPEPTFRYLLQIANSTQVQLRTEPVPQEAAQLRSLRRELLALLEPCRTLVSGRPSSQAAFNEIVSNVENAFDGTQNIGNIRSAFDGLATDCTNLAFIFAGRSLPSNTQSSYISCSLTANGSSNSFDLNSLGGMLPTPEDKDGFLQSVFSYRANRYLFNSGSYSSSSSTGENNYSYNPFESAELIERLLRNHCVKQVYVPDPWLMRRLRSRRGVIYRPFSEEDRFSINIGEQTCTEGQSSQ